MTAPTVHPSWCDVTRCGVAQGGTHESAASRVTVHGRKAPPKLMLMLFAPAKGSPVRIRMVVLADLLIATVDLSLDEVHLAANTMTKLLAEAASAE